MYLEFVPTEACELYSDNSPVADKIYTNASGRSSYRFTHLRTLKEHSMQVR